MYRSIFTSWQAPLSSQVEGESQPEPTDIGDKLLSLWEKFDDFKASKQAKLEEWLEGTSIHGENCLAGDEKWFWENENFRLSGKIL